MDDSCRDDPTSNFLGPSPRFLRTVFLSWKRMGLMPVAAVAMDPGASRHKDSGLLSKSKTAAPRELGLILDRLQDRSLRSSFLAVLPS